MTIDRTVSTLLTSPAVFTPAIKVLNGVLQLSAVVRNVPVLSKLQQACDAVLDVFLCVRELPNGIRGVIFHLRGTSKPLVVSNIAFCAGTVLDATLVLERWNLIRVANAVVQVARTRFLTPLFVVGWSTDLVDAVQKYGASTNRPQEVLRIANDVLAIASAVLMLTCPALQVVPMSFYVIRQICNCAGALLVKEPF